tara:strand:- start:328 stop:729 length:402 start_codon:yes stop_codon:yes gene_type:complete
MYNEINANNRENIDFLTNKMVFKYTFEENMLMTWRRMESKFGNLCCICRKNIYVGSEIFWNNDGSSRVKHYDCNATTRGARAVSVLEESVDSSEFSSELFPISTEEEIERNMGNKNFRSKKKEREFSEEEESL